MKLYSYAKVNLNLTITEKIFIEKKNSYYHLLSSLFSYIDLYDELDISVNQNNKHIINANYQLDLDSNIMIKMINLFHKYYQIKQVRYFTINHQKNIPMQAGLGGGSSNAVAILDYLYKFYNISDNLENKILLTKELGADLAFFLTKKSKYINGIGEKFIGEVDYPQLPILLIKPKTGLATQEVFKNLQFINHKKKISIDYKANYSAIDFWYFLKNSHNDLEIPAQKLCPEIREILNFNCDTIDFITKMTGSGSACMMICKNMADLEILYKLIKDKFFYIVKSSLLTSLS